MIRLKGLVAATFTPMRDDGALNLSLVPQLVDHLLSQGVTGLYVCGSTGEGPLLTSEERRATAQAYVEATAGRIPVVVQVGHTSLAEASSLAAHAQDIGADAISAVPPFYFKPDSVENVITCLAEITGAAPRLPFYYYHIPMMTDVKIDVIEMLTLAESRLPTLAGVKFSSPMVAELQACLEFRDQRFDILFGVDEMLLSALVVGAEGAVGSTYNFLAPAYQRVIDAYTEERMDDARAHQASLVEIVRVIVKYQGMPGLKATMKLLGLDCGPCRLPLRGLDDAKLKSLRDELSALGFFDVVAQASV